MNIWVSFLVYWQVHVFLFLSAYLVWIEAQNTTKNYFIKSCFWWYKILLFCSKFNIKYWRRNHWEKGWHFLTHSQRLELPLSGRFFSIVRMSGKTSLTCRILKMERTLPLKHPIQMKQFVDRKSKSQSGHLWLKALMKNTDFVQQSNDNKETANWGINTF